MKKLKKPSVLAMIMISLAMFGFSLVPISTCIAKNTVTTDICKQENVAKEVLEANGCKGKGKISKAEETVINILKAVIGSIGIVAAIFVVIGGVNYMTSSGDAAKVQKAKSTIIYAIIGMVICALAFAIVNFVITKIINKA